MRITSLRDNLKKSLNLCARVVGGNMTLPVLNNVLLKTEGGQLKIASTNLEIAVKSWVGGQIDEQGEITVPAKTLSDLVNSVSDEKITLETDGTDLKVKTKQTESVLKGLPADEFPLIPEIKNEKGFSVSAKELNDGLSQVAFATTYSETQPELSGVLFKTSGKELRLAATDRYRLAEKVIELDQSVNEQNLIVPARAVAELSKAIGEGEKKIEIFVADNQILFKGSGVEIISRLIEGNFPDYQQIIPQEFNSVINLKVEELASAVKLSGLFAQDNNNVELEIKPESSSVILTANSQKAGANTTALEGKVTGQQNKIVFNYRYILDCLNHLHAKEISLKVIDSGSPAMIVPQNSKNYLYLVMPIKT